MIGGFGKLAGIRIFDLGRSLLAPKSPQRHLGWPGRGHVDKAMQSPNSTMLNPRSSWITQVGRVQVAGAQLRFTAGDARIRLAAGQPRPSRVVLVDMKGCTQASHLEHQALSADGAPEKWLGWSRSTPASSPAEEEASFGAAAIVVDTLLVPPPERDHAAPGAPRVMPPSRKASTS